MHVTVEAEAYTDSWPCDTCGHFEGDHFADCVMCGCSAYFVTWFHRVLNALS